MKSIRSEQRSTTERGNENTKHGKIEQSRKSKERGGPGKEEYAESSEQAASYAGQSPTKGSNQRSVPDGTTAPNEQHPHRPTIFSGTHQSDQRLFHGVKLKLTGTLQNGEPNDISSAIPT